MGEADSLTSSSSSSPAPLLLVTGLIEQAEQHPDELAMCDQRRSMSFAELEALSGALAVGVAEACADGAWGNDSWMPVIVDRSVEAAVALHAVARAGVRFSPIEASTPVDRIAELVSRLGGFTAAVVTHERYSGLLPDGVRPIVATGGMLGSLAPVAVDGSAAGVVVFTSGSTGRPKGVVRRWSAMNRSNGEIGGGPELGERSRIALLRPFSFAAGLGRIRLLADGHSLHIADPGRMSSEELLSWLAGQEVANLSVGSTLAATLVRAAHGKRRLPAVTALRLGTEATDWEIIPALRTLVAADAVIHLGFGATEARGSMGVSVGPNDPIGAGRIPLGVPTSLEHIRVEPIDGPGSPTQLVLGDSVALGYLGDPELTAQCFVTDPHGKRWWLSGDIVHVDSGGVFHHSGRIDEMVKINGVLIEPAEVEAVLRAVPGIGNAAVLVHRSGSPRPRLVGHVQVDDPSLTPEKVRGFLAARLPAHLMPAMLVRHEQLPFNERNKLDRQGLLSGEWERWRSSPPAIAMSELELWVCGQIATVVGLAVGEVGAVDDVWDLGLDSMGAVEFCGAVSDAGLGEIEPTRLLEARSATTIAALLATGAPQSASTAIVLNGGGSRPALFAVPGAGGTALAFRALAQALGVDQPVVIVEPVGMHVAGAPDRTVEVLAGRVIDEIETHLQAGEPCVVMGHSAGGTIAWEVAQRQHAGGRRTTLILLDATPGRSGDNVAGDNLSGARRVRTVADRVRGRSVWQLLRGAPSTLRWHVMMARVRRLARRPGSPSHDPVRYRAFHMIMSRAVRGYAPRRAEFDVTLVAVEASRAGGGLGELAPTAGVYVVGGDHNSMLQPPHARHVAEIVAASAQLLRL